MNRFSLLILMVLSAPFSTASEPDWTLYGEILEAYVSPGEIDGTQLTVVDYVSVASDPRFAVVVDQVRSFDVTRLETEAEHLAFYINAYNILTIQLIIDHWPLESIRDIGNFFRGPWDIVMLENADGALTLDDIEHVIIRGYPEPRIHFAVNCASVGCPDLRREPYTVDRLDEQLDEQTRQFFANPAKGFRIERGDARVTKLLRWYDEDFKDGIDVFVRRYVDADFDDISANLPYSWKLNAPDG